MIRRLIATLRRARPCRHVFVGAQMGRRDEGGILAWPCCRCGQVFHFEYGLQAGRYGVITGPWGAWDKSGIPCFYPHPRNFP
ncbi:hypothetical protein [Aeromonas veronii]|uniref:hypothetical protein n=1 Tax=Aeromonas veronii TaxID=654 RepID=UPI003D1A9E7B